MDNVLNRIIGLLELLADQLNKDDGTVAAEEVLAVLKACDQADQELGSVLDRYQYLGVLDEDDQPDPFAKPLPALPASDSYGGDGWAEECRLIDTFRSLLQTRVNRISSLSRYGHFHTAVRF